MPPNKFPIISLLGKNSHMTEARQGYTKDKILMLDFIINSPAFGHGLQFLPSSRLFVRAGIVFVFAREVRIGLENPLLTRKVRWPKRVRLGTNEDIVAKTLQLFKIP